MTAGRTKYCGCRKRYASGATPAALAALLSLTAPPLHAATPLQSAAEPKSDDIVVTAPVGEALVEPEAELTEADIAAYGASTIGDLIARITPLTGRPGEQPIVLVNGKRIDGVGSVNGFPPEALARLAILRPEAAARYGYASDRRIVNVVLKRHFSAWQSEAGAGMATAGGRASTRASIGRFVIDGDTRWNAQLQASRDEPLLQSERDGRRDPASRARTLLPSADAASLNLTVARPLGQFVGTVAIDAAKRGQRQLLGLGPAEDTAARALRGDRDTSNIGLSTMVAGNLDGWNGSLILRYGRSWSDASIERIAPASTIAIETTRSRSENLSAQFNLNRTILTLPAGAATANLTIGTTRNWSASQRTGRPLPAAEFRRRQTDAQLSLTLPLSSASGGTVGDLSLDLAAGLGSASGSLQKRYEASVNWSPVAALELRAATGFADLVPTPDQIGGAYVEEIRHIYDIRRQETVDALWITGGNPDLGRGTQRSYSLRAALRPFGPAPLTLTFEYRRQEASGGVAAFPTLTPAVEDAFPERVRRDAAGRLLSVDARPIAIAHDIDERLDSSLILAIAAHNRSEHATAKANGSRWQATLAVTHGLLLRSELVTRPGLPPLDRIDGDVAQSRHTLGFQFVASKPGLGITLDGSWQSPFRLRNPALPGGRGDYHYRGVLTANLRLHAEPDKLLPKGNSPAWLSNLQISFDIRNLLGTYRKVALADGTVPAGYRRYDVDPLGRSVQLSLRKRF